MYFTVSVVRMGGQDQTVAQRTKKPEVSVLLAIFR